MTRQADALKTVGHLAHLERDRLVGDQRLLQEKRSLLEEKLESLQARIRTSRHETELLTREAYSSPISRLTRARAAADAAQRAVADLEEQQQRLQNELATLHEESDALQQRIVETEQTRRATESRLEGRRADHERETRRRREVDEDDAVLASFVRQRSRD